MPLELPGREIHSENRAGIQIVQVLCAAEFLRPRLRIPGPDINQVGVGIATESIPHRAAAAFGVEIAAPRFGGRPHVLVLEGLAGIAWNRIESPRSLPG